MNKVILGKYVNTHGLKGEIRIKSNFPYKSRVFVIDNEIIIDNKTYIIKSYRVHKGYDMVTLNDYQNINDVLFLLKQDVYVDKDSLSLEDDEVLDEDLLQYEVLTNDGKKGIIKEIFYASSNNKILRIMLDREVLIPYSSPMIKKIDKENKVIYIELIEGL